MRAIALVRVSQRDKEALSPEVQRRAVIRLAAEHGWTLDERDILDENVDDNGRVRNVSGGWALEDRPKLRYALEEVEAGRAQVILGERFDRLFRNELLRRMVVKRLEDRGGQLWSDKGGEMTNQRAEGRLAHNVNGDVSEYTLETAKERSWDAVELAIEQGIYNGPVAPLGYVIGADRRLQPDSKRMVKVVRGAFALRLGGATAEAVQTYLAERGVVRSRSGVRAMLASRVYVGELHAGEHTPNLRAHPAIIDRDGVFDPVQRMVVPAGRKGKARRLLSRLQVLRCGTCDGRMSATTTKRGYPFYRCSNDECPHPLTISAAIVEGVVHDAMPGLLAGRVGRASEVEQYEQAKIELDQAQERYDALMADYDPLEAADVERRRALRDVLEQARAEVARFDGASSVELPIGRAWNDLTFAEQRRGIRLHVARVLVRPGRGAGRVSVEPLP